MCIRDRCHQGRGGKGEFLGFGRHWSWNILGLSRDLEHGECNPVVDAVIELLLGDLGSLESLLEDGVALLTLNDGSHGEDKCFALGLGCLYL